MAAQNPNTHPCQPDRASALALPVVSPGRRRRHAWLAITLGLLGALGSHGSWTGQAAAGPPLLCPDTVLTPEEQTLLAPVTAGDRAGSVAVATLIDVLGRSNSGRFHVEALRAFAQRRGEHLPDLIAALEQLQLSGAANGPESNQPESNRTAEANRLFGFDLPLVRVLEGYYRPGALAWVDEMARVADALEDPALLLTVAEAIDLVGLESGGGHPRHLFRRLSQAYFARGLDRLIARAVPDTDPGAEGPGTSGAGSQPGRPSGSPDGSPSTGDASPTEASPARPAADPWELRLYAVHLEYLRAMHAQGWDWDALRPHLERVGLTKP